MKVGNLEVLIGADPELFMKKGRYFVSAHDMVPGTKALPHPVDKGAIQVDGMALEFNIDPAATEDEFVENLQTVMGELKRRVPDYKVLAIPTAHFSKKVWQEAPEEAKEMGCEPDFNAWTGAVNPRPNADADFRTGAGHVHIGWTHDADINDPDHIEACRMVCRELDARLGIASLKWDRDGERRELYGCAGAFRPKSYGVEYRTLSNRWLSDEKLMRFVYQQVIETIRHLSTHRVNDRFSEQFGEDIRRVIDTNDINGMKEAYLRHFQIKVPGVEDKYNV